MSANPPPGPRGPERGSGTVLALALVMVLCLLTASGTVLLSAVVASHRARAAADLAALAAAGPWVEGVSLDSACARATRVAAANGATLRSCAASGESLVVAVGVRPGIGLVPAAEARARAGPPPGDGGATG